MTMAAARAAPEVERTRRPWPAPSLFTLLGATLIVILVGLVVTPLLRLAISSFQAGDGSGFTLANYAVAYGVTRHLNALKNSLLIATCVTALAIIFAVPLAWAISRTDMPAKGLVRTLVLGTVITPPYLGAVGWILLAGPNSGVLNKFYKWLTGSPDALFNVYSFEGLVLLIALYSFPYIFFFTLSALDNVSSEMEDAAHILGAGTVRTAALITLPLVFPAIIGGAIITFLESITLFGTPALIALPARIDLVTTQLWEFFEYPVRLEVAAAYAIPLLLIVAAAFGLQHLILGRRGFLTVTGKAGERRTTVLGPWRWVALGYALLVLSLSVFLPYGMMLQAAFSKAWGLGFSSGNFTFGNFYYILFEHYSAKQSIVNSFIYAGAAALFAAVLALCAAYIGIRKLVPLSGALPLLCMAPFIVPGIILAVAFYAAYAPPPLSLYGTGTIIVLAFTTRFLPIAYANCAAGVRSLNPEMEEAVRILGGNRLIAVRSVVAPLMKKTLAASFILVFISAIRELSAAIFLVGPSTRVMSVLLLDLSEEGNFETLAALGCIMMASVIVIMGAGYRLLGRDFMVRQ
jgi:iron(III) transport system permease protein